MFSYSFRSLALAACVACSFTLGDTSVAHAASDTVVRTTQQGVHSWKTAEGKLFMVAGTYQDAVTYRRSMSFYFQANGESNWRQVPIVESPVDFTTEWTSASRGEATLRDAVVVPRGNAIYLVIANRVVDKPTIAVARYKFSMGGEDYPDAPEALFVPLSASSYPLAKTKSIEAVLDKELVALPKN
jgi:hypothetical protein